MSVPPENVVPPPPPGEPPSPPPVDPPAPSGGLPSHEERQWALLAHLSALLGLLGGVFTLHFGGLGCIIGPLVIWLLKRESMPFVDDQAKEALNFNITAAIAFIVSSLLIIVLIGILLLPVVFIAWIVLVIIAAIKANEGERYRYPFALRLIK